MKYKEIKKKFENTFSTNPLLVRSPGRINLIGEHTDYNEGFVLPAAIDKEIILAFGKNNSGECRLLSHDYEDAFTFDLDDFSPRPSGWANYIMGVVAQLKKYGYDLEGFDCVFGGNIPIGAGLSSSAALENGVCLGLSELFGLGLDRISMLKFAQKAEHEFAGVQCGIMDQFASMMGKENHAIQLDCRSLDFTYFPIELKDYQLILCDTQVEHSLADTAYNKRREECESGVNVVKAKYPQVSSLRDVSLEMLEELKNEMAPLVYQRCRYVLEENARVLESCGLLAKGDIIGFGEQMYASHHGLSKEYEVSCEELDFLVDITKGESYVVGSRMMGGGFGGCTLNLVKTGEKEKFLESVISSYKKQFGKKPKIYEVAIKDGTGVVKSS